MRLTFKIGITMIGLFSSLFDQDKHNPYNNKAINQIYELLFCDNITLYKSESGNQNISAYPWSSLFVEKPSVPLLRKVADDISTPTRARLLAFNELRGKNEKISTTELLGVIIEVGMINGLDVLAVYKDKTVRYINQSGRMIILEPADSVLDSQIDKVFAEASKVIKQIGPWEKKRLDPPSSGMLRLTFLVSDGLYFGEGTIDDLSNDQLGGPVFSAGTLLMQSLIERTPVER